jgi:hemolysin activation/secretion protein
LPPQACICGEEPGAGRIAPAWFAALLVLLCASAYAGPIVIPDSARPGAVRPEDSGRPLRPPEPAQEVLSVPPVIDRPFEVDEGPYVIVRQFRLLDARDLKRHRIQVSEIEQILEQARQERPEGFSIGQLQQAADLVTQYYRERGLILAHAVVPVQDVDDGVVELQIYEGTLGRIIAEGNKLYSEKRLQVPFKGLIGQPVHRQEIETALLQLTDYPGLSIFGIFQPGQVIGTTDLVLRVQEEDRFDIAYRFDNHGQQQTGRLRFRPTVEWNNITRTGDQLALSIQQTYNPEKSTFKSIDYKNHLPYGIQIGFSYNNNEFDVAGRLASLQISAESEQIGGWIEKNWIRSRLLNFSTRARFVSKDSETTARGNPTNRDALSVLSIEAIFDQVDTRFRGINLATVEFSHGFNDMLDAIGKSSKSEALPAGLRPSRQGGSGSFAEGEFNKLFATASRLQSVRPNMSLLLRSEFQWSEDLLLPMEQYSMGGPDNVRAFPQAQFLMDKALFGSLELIHNMPFITDVRAFGNRTWGELIQLALFFDYAIGRLNDPLASEVQDWADFGGAGFQARFTVPNMIESRLIVAWDLIGDDEVLSFQHPDRDVRPANDRRPQFWADFTFRW